MSALRFRFWNSETYKNKSAGSATPNIFVYPFGAFGQAISRNVYKYDCRPRRPQKYSAIF